MGFIFKIYIPFFPFSFFVGGGGVELGKRGKTCQAKTMQWKNWIPFASGKLYPVI